MQVTGLPHAAGLQILHIEAFADKAGRAHSLQILPVEVGSIRAYAHRTQVTQVATSKKHLAGQTILDSLVLLEPTPSARRPLKGPVDTVAIMK